MSEEMALAEWVHGLDRLKEMFRQQSNRFSRLRAVWFCMEDEWGDAAAKVVASGLIEQGELAPISANWQGRPRRFYVTLANADQGECEAFASFASQAADLILIRPKSFDLLPNVFAAGCGGVARWFWWVAAAVLVGRKYRHPLLAVNHFDPIIRDADYRAALPPDLLSQLTAKPNHLEMVWPVCMDEVCVADHRWSPALKYIGPYVNAWITAHDVWTLSEAAMELICQAANTRLPPVKSDTAGAAVKLTEPELKVLFHLNEVDHEVRTAKVISDVTSVIREYQERVQAEMESMAVPDGCYAPSDIAKAIGAEGSKEAIRKALKRLRDDNRLPDGAWMENADPAKGQARILYRLSAVRPFLERFKGG